MQIELRVLENTLVVAVNLGEGDLIGENDYLVLFRFALGVGIFGAVGVLQIDLVGVAVETYNSVLVKLGIIVDDNKACGSDLRE